MATFTKVKLSGAGTTNGPINAYGGTPGGSVTLHTTDTSSSVLDEIWIYAWSQNGSDMYLDFEINGTTMFSANFNVYANGLNTPQLVIPGFVLSGNGTTGTTIKVVDTQFSGTTFIMGYVNRIS